MCVGLHLNCHYRHNVISHWQFPVITIQPNSELITFRCEEYLSCARLGPPYRPQSWPSVCTKYFQDVSVSFRISADFYLCRFHQPFLCVYLILKVASVQFDGHTDIPLTPFSPMVQTTAPLPNSYQLIIIGEWIAIGASH